MTPGFGNDWIHFFGKKEEDWLVVLKVENDHPYVPGVSNGDGKMPKKLIKWHRLNAFEGTFFTSSTHIHAIMIKWHRLNFWRHIFTSSTHIHAIMKIIHEIHLQILVTDTHKNAFYLDILVQFFFHCSTLKAHQKAITDIRVCTSSNFKKNT